MEDSEIGLHIHEKFIYDRRDNANKQRKDNAIKCTKII